VNKRDYIQEILSKRERLISPGTRLSHFADRTKPLHQGFIFLTEEKIAAGFRDEFVKYLPIGYVAAIEAYFRLAYRDLIDFGPPYSENLKSLRDVKFQIESVIAMTSRTVSVGEFIAHLLPLKNLGNINENMSMLIGEDFLTRLKKTKLTVMKGAEELAMDHFHSFIPDGIQKIFQLRHVFCHEFAVKEKPDMQEIRDCCYAAFIFIIATESLLNELNVYSTLPAKT
jgi:hypothetical protein